MATAFVIHRDDNVATLLSDTAAGAEVLLLGEAEGGRLVAADKVAEGHKIALMEIRSGDPVTKYGAIIGIATRQISPGCWVHLHNCRSRVDDRSSTLDVETGASTEIRYE